MASAMYPDDINMPPPYSVQDGSKVTLPYQQQVPPPVYSPNLSNKRKYFNAFNVFVFYSYF